jgi:hypothetical protein
MVRVDRIGEYYTILVSHCDVIYILCMRDECAVSRVTDVHILRRSRSDHADDCKNARLERYASAGRDTVGIGDRGIF